MSPEFAIAGANDLPIRCRCGALRGIVANVATGDSFRVICYCSDCQAFAQYLEERSNEQILDYHGGTDIYQMSPARLTITQGGEQLACLRVTPRGPLRWYSDCCWTPIGNTLATRQLPFVGLIRFCIDVDDRAIDQMLGPVSLRVMAHYAKGDVSSLDVHDRFLVSHIAGVFFRIAKWRLRGDHKRSPFFDSKTGRPVAEPLWLNEESPTGA